MNIDYFLLLNTLIILGIALISPGPDFFLVLKNSLRYGKTAGVMTGIGIATGCLISFTIVVIGVSYLFKYPTVKLIMNILCGSYLFYIGISCFKVSKGHHAVKEIQVKEHVSNWKMFISGLLTNILNPKLYSLTTGIMAYVESEHPSSTTNLSIIICQGLMALVWFNIVARVFSSSYAQEVYFAKESLLNKLIGIIFMFVGVLLVVKM